MQTFCPPPLYCWLLLDAGCWLLVRTRRTLLDALGTGYEGLIRLSDSTLCCIVGRHRCRTLGIIIKSTVATRHCVAAAAAALSSSQSIIEDSSKNWNWITLALNAASRITFEPPFRSLASTTSPRTGQHCFSSCAAAAAAAKGKLSIG